MTTDTRSRLRGFVRRPGRGEVARLAELEHLALDERELDATTALIDVLLGALDDAEDLHRELAAAAAPPARVPGRPPVGAEDPFNAVIRWCDVRGADEGPLAGLTCGVKDCLAVAGVPQTSGSRRLAYVPSIDAVVVERLLAAGARIVAKLNQDDAQIGGTGETSCFGPPRNPHDPQRSAGGSSGGTGAAVAGGLVDLGIAGDSGGSARVPAAFCGAVTLKPTHGRVPSHGIDHVDHTLDNVCPMTTSVAALARVIDVISGHDDRDPQWTRSRPERSACTPAAAQAVEGLRIGVIEQALDGCEPAVQSRFDASVEGLREQGAVVERVSVPLWRRGLAIRVPLYAMAMWATFQSDGQGWGHLGEIDVARAHAFAVSRRQEANDLPPTLKAWLVFGRYLAEHGLARSYGVATNLRRAMRDDIDAALARCDALLTPTTPFVAPRLRDEPLDVDALLRGTDGRAGVNTAPLNLSGHPALALPNGVDEHGMPTSLQVIAAHHADETAVRVAASAERALATVPPPDPGRSEAPR